MSSITPKHAVAYHFLNEEAIRLFYRQIELHHGIPFDVKLPNRLTAETLRKSELGEDVHRAEDTDDLFDQLGI